MQDGTLSSLGPGDVGPTRKSRERGKVCSHILHGSVRCETTAGTSTLVAGGSRSTQSSFQTVTLVQTFEVTRILSSQGLHKMTSARLQPRGPKTKARMLNMICKGKCLLLSHFARCFRNCRNFASDEQRKKKYEKKDTKDIWNEDEVIVGAEYDDACDTRQQPE